MAMALEEASAAGRAGEVPVGAVIVKDGVLIAAGRNAPIACNDPTAHAEIRALRNAAAALTNYRINGCTLYVTLEPCSMCVGAMLHSRISRLVYGAPDPKTGAATSVLNLFAHSELNHHTAVQGGVLATESSALLTDFFKHRRQHNKSASKPLREDALRTADACFEAFTASKYKSHYLSHSPVLAGLQLHYLDEGPRVGTDVLLCMHSNSGWGIEFWNQIDNWVGEGKRVIVPDLIGFGRSDKFKRQSAHSVDFHSKCLIALLNHLQVRQAILIAPNNDLALPGRVAELAAPYPDKGYKSALIAFELGGMNTLKIGQDALQYLTNT
jgi:tRNA(adenine34) deaminase